MRIDHVAIWAVDLDRLKRFYETYFDGRAGDKYENPAKRFESYIIIFTDGARLELMHRPDLAPNDERDPPAAGQAHLAFSVGSRERVDELTHRLQADGYRLLDGPRTTGDGFYESCFFDPEGNRVELTV